MPPKRKKRGTGASATSAAKKNTKPLSLAMSSDEEENQGKEAPHSILFSLWLHDADC